jgi:hypothetical protein
VAPWQAQLDRPLAPELIDAQRQAAQVHAAVLQRLLRFQGERT